MQALSQLSYSPTDVGGEGTGRLPCLSTSQKSVCDRGFELQRIPPRAAGRTAANNERISGAVRPAQEALRFMAGISAAATLRFVRHFGATSGRTASDGLRSADDAADDIR